MHNQQECLSSLPQSLLLACCPIKLCGSGLTLQMARITKVWFIFLSCVNRILTYANSVLNPFIHALKGTEFRSGFMRIGQAGMRSFRSVRNRTTKFSYKVNNDHQVPKRSSPLLKPLQKLISFALKKLTQVARNARSILLFKKTCLWI